MRRKRLGYPPQAAELAEIKAASPASQDIPSQVLQEVLRRLDKAVAAFFGRIRNGEQPGYPRLEAAGPLRLVHLPPIRLCPGGIGAHPLQNWRRAGASAPRAAGDDHNRHHQAGGEMVVGHLFR
jgi:hypothetical protein